MGKDKLKAYVSEYGADFSKDGHVLYCKVCEIKIIFEKKYNILQHIKTDKHQRNFKRKNDQAQRKCQQF